MHTIIKKASWWIFGFLSVIVGMYPLTYFIIDRRFGLLSTKSAGLLLDGLWNVGFYGHIIFGGIALSIGWVQFSPKVRGRNLNFHRKIGVLYVVSVLISSVCGIFIGFFATGGYITV